MSGKTENNFKEFLTLLILILLNIPILTFNEDKSLGSKYDKTNYLFIIQENLSNKFANDKDDIKNWYNKKLA